MRLGRACSAALARLCFILAGAAVAGSCSLAQPDRGPNTTVERAVLPMAQAALDAGQVETARRLYTRLLEVDPGSIAARMGLGKVAMSERDPQTAASWYLASAVHASLPGERHAALLAHARAALAAGQHDAALRSFARLASPEENASDTHAAWAHNGIGMVRWLEGDPRAALAAIEQAMLRDPDEPAFRSNLAVAAEMLSSMALAPSPAAPDAEGTGGSPTPAVDADHSAISAEHAPSAETPEPRRPDDAVGPVEVDSAETSERAAERAEVDAAVQEDALDGAPEVGPAAGSPALAHDTHDDSPAEAESVAGPPDSADDTDGGLTVGPVGESPEAAAALVPEAVPEDLRGDSAPIGTAGLAERPPADEGNHAATVGDADRSTGSALPTRLAEMASHSALAGNGVAVADDGNPGMQPASDLGAFLLDGEDGAAYVQVGAYSNRARADALRDRLQALTDIPVAVRETDGVDAPHRVRIGPVYVDELGPLASALEANGFGGVRTSADAKAVGNAKSIVVADAGGEFLQVGAYEDVEVAEALAARLRELTGEPVSVTAWTKDDGVLVHRVRIGPLDPARSAALAELVGTATAP